tara:strand:- start:439 stop:726 length:288 start_codon:yes stop_codon:yes gene_type:complete
MGLMDEAIKDTIKDTKDFKKTDLKRLATRNKQIGGNHYKNLSIQPVDYIVENNLTYLEGNIIKYITRHRRKGDGKKDIEKVIHYAEMILEMEYGE